MPPKCDELRSIANRNPLQRKLEKVIMGLAMPNLASAGKTASNRLKHIQADDPGARSTACRAHASYLITFRKERYRCTCRSRFVTSILSSLTVAFDRRLGAKHFTGNNGASHGSDSASRPTATGRHRRQRGRSIERRSRRCGGWNRRLHNGESADITCRRDQRYQGLIR